MKLVLLAAVVLAGCNACQPTPAPPPPGPPVPTIMAVTVYNEMVAAKCMDPDDGGAAAMQEAHLADYQEPWMACMFNGGTVVGCRAPCE